MKEIPMNGNKERKTSLNIFAIIVGFISILVGLFILLTKYNYESHQLLFLLPLLYGLMLLVCPSMTKNLFKNVGLSVFNVILLVRYLIYPLLTSLDLSNGKFSNNIASTNSINLATILICIELIVSFILIQIISPYFYKNEKKHRRNIDLMNKKFILICVLFLGISLLFLFPSILDNYNFFIVTDELTSNSLNFPLSGLILLIVDTIFIIFPLLMLNYFKKRYDLTESIKFIVLSLIIIVPFISIIEGTSRMSMLIPALTWLVILVKLYPKYVSVISKFFLVSILIVLTSVTLYKQFDISINNTNDIKTDSFSNIFNVYFSGVDNMSYAIELEKSYGNLITLETFKNDLINNVAILSNFSDSSNTSISWFNLLIYGNEISRDQIIPITGQGYIYFGLIFAPILLVLNIIFMAYFDRKIREEEKIEFIYVYAHIAIIWAMSMMLSTASIYPMIFNLALPIWFIFYFNRKIKFSVRK